MPWTVGGLLAAAGIACVPAGRAFLRSEQPAAGERLERLSGVWTLTLYLALGLAPRVVG